MKKEVSPELFVVGIGSSAGGLEPLTELLRNSSCHRSMCFILVPHLSRSSESNLPSILAAFSTLEVKQIRSGMPLEHCKVYVLPPGQHAAVVGNILTLRPRPTSGPNNSADVLFMSLAIEYGRNAVGVVLSGASVGADGSAGVVEIRKRGGRNYAQDPSTARFPGMPQLAIETGCVDAVMPASQIGKELSTAIWKL